jgi:hypothetical protein
LRGCTVQLRTAADIAAYIVADPWRWAVLDAVRRQRLPDWAVGADFIRSAVWEALHGHADPTPLADVDVLFFDTADVSRERELALETAWGEAMADVPWSVRNQARIHRRNGDPPYRDTVDALRFWLETPTAVAMRIGDDGAALPLAPFGVEDLLGMVCRPTPRGRQKLSQYQSRMRERNLHARWPRVRIFESDLQGSSAAPVERAAAGGRRT